MFPLLLAVEANRKHYVPVGIKDHDKFGMQHLMYIFRQTLDSIGQLIYSLKQNLS